MNKSDAYCQKTKILDRYFIHPEASVTLFLRCCVCVCVCDWDGDFCESDCDCELSPSVVGLALAVAFRGATTPAA